MGAAEEHAGDGSVLPASHNPNHAALRRRYVELPADRTDECAVDLAVTRHGSASARIVARRPDRVSRAFAALSAAMRGQVPLDVAEPHSATVTRSASLVAPGGSGTGSPSSR